VKISFDPTKNQRNIEERNLPFSLVENFDFNTAQITVDTRIDYGEVRYVAIGLLNERVHVVCFKETENGIRVISFRKANDREAKRYEKFKSID
jgi:uncharacterized protein